MINSKLALIPAVKPLSMLASASSAGSAAGILAFVLIFILILVAIVVLIVFSMWKIYEKAGVPGWAVFVPFYGTVKLLQITNKPFWWVILFFVPFLNIILGIILTRRLAGVFGKGVGFTWGLVLLPFIFYPILAFGKSNYANTYPAPGPMSEAVKWALAAAVLYMVIESAAVSSFLKDVSSQASVAPLTVVSTDLGYAKDANYVYYDDTPLNGADAETFKVKGNYGMDDSNVYYADQTVIDADPATFTVLSGGDYAKSPTQIYYDGVVVPYADHDTFTVLGSDGYAKDSDTVYYEGQPVTDADPSTFVLTTDPTGTEEYDAKDKNGYYEEGSAYTPSAVK